MNKATSPQSTPGTYALVNHLPIYYEVHGEGMPLVLVHGGGSTLEATFGRIMPLLAAKRMVIALELQAHGRTGDRTTPLSFEQDADDIAALLQHLKIEQADVFGFSNGATTTLQCAIRHPNQVRKIIVGSTFYNRAGAPHWFWDMMGNPSFEQMPAALKDAFLQVNPDPKALYRMYERDVARMQSFPDISDEEMQAIRAPSLIIAGDLDVVSAGHLVQMHQMLPNSRLAILPGGHGDYIGEINCDENPVLIAATADIIHRFLE